MLSKKNILAFLIFSLILSLSLFADTPGKKIAIVGDLQKTSPWEFLMAREENDIEREKVIKAISDENPGVIILLGDMVYDGSEKRQWNEFKRLIQPISKHNIPIYPILGNHEYWGNNYTAMQNVREVFPILKKSNWYSVVYDELALIFLDSNSPELTPKDWDEQRLWFEEQIKNYDSDPVIKGIFVFVHHPPYTNSIVTGDEIPIQETICPAFSNSKKGMIMFSGHAHTYEKFYIKDKYYIVSGGGGGPRIKVKTGLQYHHDLITTPSPRPFHYITMEREDNGVRLMVKAINKGGSNFYKYDAFTLYFKY